MQRNIRSVGLIATFGLVAGCGVFQAIGNWIYGREQGTSCIFNGTELAQAVGINGFINASLPCPTLLFGGPRSVGFQGSIVANANSVFPTIYYSLKNRLGNTVWTANQSGYVDGSQRVWQPNYTITIGTGGVSGTSSQDVDSLIAVGTAAGGGTYIFWAPIQYRTTAGMQAQWNGTPWEGRDFLVYANVQDPDLTPPIKFDWEMDGNSVDFNTGSNQLVVPGGAAGTWHDVRVTATGANGRQAIASQTVTFQTCTAECNQFRVSKNSSQTGGNH